MTQQGVDCVCVCTPDKGEMRGASSTCGRAARRFGLSTLPAARVQTSRAGEGCAGQDLRFEWRLDASVLNDLVGGVRLRISHRPALAIAYRPTNPNDALISYKTYDSDPYVGPIHTTLRLQYNA